MRTNKTKLTITGGLFALLVMAGGCGKEKAAEQNAGSEKPVTSIDQRLSENCECGIPIYRCAECRYEAGVVKLDASLMKNADGTGLVRTQVVTRAKMSEVLPVTGEVALNENAAVHISPRIAGIIESVPVDIGARVKAGDLLLTLASVELGKAVAEYERNRTLSELSGKILERETKLLEQNVGSGQDVIEARMAFEQHRSSLKASEQMLHVLGLTDDDLANAQELEAGRLPVRAPVAGTIIEKHAVTGEMVEPGKDLMMLSDLTTVWVWASVHSRDLGKLLAAETRPRCSRNFRGCISRPAVQRDARLCGRDYERTDPHRESAGCG